MPHKKSRDTTCLILFPITINITEEILEEKTIFFGPNYSYTHEIYIIDENQ